MLGLLLALTLTDDASAQAVSLDRPVVPSAGIATEGGPGTLWVNPANLAYDRDPRYGLFFGYDLNSEPSSVAVTTGIGGLSVGLHHVAQPDGGDWSIDYATSVALPRRVALGLRLGWHLVHDGENYVAYDLAASWRPLPWFGGGAVAQNVGSSGLERAPARTGVGAGLRPFGRTLILGADWVHRLGTTTAEGEPNLDEEQLLHATARLRPIQGMYIRGHVDTRLTEDGEAPQVGWGAGLELYFWTVGAGAHAQVADTTALADPLTAGTGIITWLGTDEPGEALIRSNRRAPVLDLDGAPVYRPVSSIFSDPEMSWLELLELLRKVEEDRGVQALVVRVGGRTSMPWALREELRDRLAGIAASGKEVVVYMHASATTGDYYVATAGTAIVMHPAQQLDLIGISAQLTHFGETMAMVGVEPQVVRRSGYKSAPETFLASEPSEEALEQTNALLDDSYDTLVTALSEGRRASREDAEGWIDGGPYTPDAALELGLIDDIAYPDELDQVLDTMALGPLLAYDLVDRDAEGQSGWESPSQIAIIYVEGAITPGDSSRGGLFGPQTTGSRTVVQQLQAAADNAAVQAIVIRVDSPGGSAFASDEIHRAVAEVRDTGKPVVVSMGGVAASGGYYVSAGADAIWAEPTTVTGSIGVFSMKIATEGLLDSLGVHTTALTRGRVSALYDGSAWDPVERERMERSVEAIYTQFKERVAQGRDMTMEEVEEVAQGRVWSGTRAHHNGLVDELGGLQDAIADARARAGLSPQRRVALVTYSWRGPVFEGFFTDPGAATLLRPVVRSLGIRQPPTPALPEVVGQLALYDRLSTEGPVLLMPWSLELTP